MGKGTNVQQTAAAASDVNIDITNVIETEGMAKVLEAFGLGVLNIGDRTNSILEQDIKTRQAQALLALNGQVIEAEKTNTLKKFGNVFLAGTAVYLFYKGVKR